MGDGPGNLAQLRRAAAYSLYLRRVTDLTPDEVINIAYIKYRKEREPVADFDGYMLAKVADIVRGHARKAYHRHEFGIIETNAETFADRRPARQAPPSFDIVMAYEELDRARVPDFSKRVIRLAWENGVSITSAYSQFAKPECGVRTVQKHHMSIVIKLRNTYGKELCGTSNEYERGGTM
jgi:hypothetical protein